MSFPVRSHEPAHAMLPPTSPYGARSLASPLDSAFSPGDDFARVLPPSPIPDRNGALQRSPMLASRRMSVTTPDQFETYVDEDVVSVSQVELEADEKVGVMQMNKTRLCRKFINCGWCPYGDECKFAHGKTELRPSPRPHAYKTRPCKFFHEEGHCPYGQRCFFVHSIRTDPLKSAKYNDMLVRVTSRRPRMRAFEALPLEYTPGEYGGMETLALTKARSPRSVAAAAAAAAAHLPPQHLGFQAHREHLAHLQQQHMHELSAHAVVSSTAVAAAMASSASLVDNNNIQHQHQHQQQRKPVPVRFGGRGAHAHALSFGSAAANDATDDDDITPSPATFGTRAFTHLQPRMPSSPAAAATRAGLMRPLGIMPCESPVPALAHAAWLSPASPATTATAASSAVSATTPGSVSSHLATCLMSPSASLATPHDRYVLDRND